ncbi:MAG: formyl transferase [Legionellales bacterium]|nr:formyl transferase [Legionellales bacterium]
MKKLKIGYFADGPWSHKALSKLSSDETLEIAFICTRFDTPDMVLKTKAADTNVDFMTHNNINSNEFLDRMRNYDCELFVSMSFNQIFKSELINLPHLKIINCHAGKLPFYRGRNILNWALINDEKEFGITVHYVDEGIDTGDIISQRCYPICDEDDYGTLLKCAYGECANVLYDAIKDIQNDNVKVTVQNEIHPLGFYCVSRKEGDERLEWDQTSRTIFNFVRAICEPGPQARTFLNGEEIRINRIQYLPNAPVYIGISGTIVSVECDTFFVKTSDSYIKVIEWTGNIIPRVGDRLN